jgi:hypothetical protein
MLECNVRAWTDRANDAQAPRSGVSASRGAEQQRDRQHEQTDRGDEAERGERADERPRNRAGVRAAAAQRPPDERGHDRRRRDEREQRGCNGLPHGSSFRSLRRRGYAADDAAEIVESHELLRRRRCGSRALPATAGPYLQ